jgi:hypothetical protein
MLEIEFSQAELKMWNSIFTDSQIIYALNRAVSGIKLPDLRGKLGIAVP